MNTGELISAVRVAIDFARALGITRSELAGAIQKAADENREFGEQDIAPFRQRAAEASAQLDLAIRNAEEKLGGNPESDR